MVLTDMIDYDKLIEQAKKDAKGSHPVVPSWAAIVDKKQLKEYATAIETLQVENQALRNAANGFKAENEKLRTELERVKQENDALWMYIEIIDREYRRYMDRGYIDRLDELKKTWKHGSQKED